MKYCLLIAFAFMLPFLGKGQATVTEAERLYNEGSFDSARQVYTALIEQYPDTAILYYNRGLCAYKLHRFTVAINDFNYCLLLDSLYANARYIRALALEETGEKQAAISELKRLEDIHPGFDNIAKRIKIYGFAVYVSRNWYYMLAMAFLLIVLMATVATLKASRKV